MRHVRIKPYNSKPYISLLLLLPLPLLFLSSPLLLLLLLFPSLGLPGRNVAPRWTPFPALTAAPYFVSMSRFIFRSSSRISANRGVFASPPTGCHLCHWQLSHECAGGQLASLDAPHGLLKPQNRAQRDPKRKTLKTSLIEIRGNTPFIHIFSHIL